jgi:hypothetical protein
MSDVDGMGVISHFSFAIFHLGLRIAMTNERWQMKNGK